MFLHSPQMAPRTVRYLRRKEFHRTSTRSYFTIVARDSAYLIDFTCLNWTSENLSVLVYFVPLNNPVTYNLDLLVAAGTPPLAAFLCASPLWGY